MLSFLMATTFLAIIVAVSNPVGTTLFSHLLNIGKLIVVNMILFPIWTMIIGALFSFIYLPFPRLFLASFSYLITATITILMSPKVARYFLFSLRLSMFLLF